MQFDLVSGSEHAAHALYDPAVIEPIRAGAPHAEWVAWRERQVATGRMVYYHASGDEELRLKLFVDEPFEPRAACKKSGEVDGAILRVDSGRICLSGIEDVSPAAAESDVARASVWAGTYRVTACRAEYKLSAERIREELAPQLEPGDADYVARANRIGSAVAVVALAALVTTFVFLFSHVAWRVHAVVGSAAIALLGAAVMWLVFASPRVERWNRAKDALWKRYPRTVVVLTRIADDAIPASFPPGRFGATRAAG